LAAMFLCRAAIFHYRWGLLEESPAPGRPARAPLWRGCSRDSHARETLSLQLGHPRREKPTPPGARHARAKPSPWLASHLVPPAPGARKMRSPRRARWLPACPLHPTRENPRAPASMSPPPWARPAREKPCPPAAWPRPTRGKPVSPPTGARPARQKPPNSRKAPRPCRPARVLPTKSPTSPPDGARPARQKPYAPAARHAPC
jgi:hypothetical protein